MRVLVAFHHEIQGGGFGGAGGGVGTPGFPGSPPPGELPPPVGQPPPVAVGKGLDVRSLRSYLNSYFARFWEYSGTD